MSRGGRGGGRGGRGGGRGGRPNVPWDTGEEPDARPTELFPAYAVPDARPLTSSETNSVKHLLLLRRQLHASPLYTSRRTLVHDPTAPRKMYGRDQANALYGVRNRASQDPFTAMPTYDQEQLRLARSERALPDWSARPVCRELFPAELLDVVDPPDRHSSKRRRLELSSVSALPNAEEAFGMPALNGHDDADADAPPAFDADGRPIPSAGREKLLLNKLDAIGRDDAADDDELADDDGNMDDEDQDEVYDDEDAGDYDAENYFDGGDDDGEDYGDDGDGEGTY